MKRLVVGNVYFLSYVFAVLLAIRWFNVWFTSHWSAPGLMLADVILSTATAYVALLYPILPLIELSKLVQEQRHDEVLQFRDGSFIREINKSIAAIITNERDMRAIELMVAQREKEQNMFFANASHELRTPLTTIQGYLDLMEDGIGGEINEEGRQYIKSMQQALQRITVMVNNIIDLSKIEVGRFQVEVVPFTVLDQVDFIEGQFEPLLMKKHQELVVDFDEVLPELKGDPERFKQVLANLVSNAIKYTPAGGHIHVGIHTHGDDRHAVYFTVTDDGLGIPADDLKAGRLFSKFYQVRKGDARIGSGLGLAITKELVEMMHGDIQVASVVGKGTTFTIRMPIWQEDDDDVTQFPTTNVVLHHEMRPDGTRVLPG